MMTYNLTFTTKPTRAIKHENLQNRSIRPRRYIVFFKECTNLLFHPVPVTAIPLPMEMLGKSTAPTV